VVNEGEKKLSFLQLFVISHDDTFERDTDNVVRVVKENGVSRACPEPFVTGCCTVQSSTVPKDQGPVERVEG